MYNRRYEKVFLMLRQETAGYAIGKRQPWGSCVMELKNGKGRLHLTMQGLKPFVYEVYVMAGKESVLCGAVQPQGKEGYCELKWDFDPDAVGEGKKAEELHTVLLLTEDGSAPLTAYFREKRDWKQDFMPRERKPAKQAEIVLQAAETAVLERPVPVAAAEKKEPMDTNGQIAEMQKESFHGSFQGLLAKFRQELEELEEMGVLSAEETEKIRNMGGENGREEPMQTMEKKTGLFGRNQTLSPFGDGAVWKRLSLEELTLLSEIPLKWQKEFFFLLPWRKYHHLILQESDGGIWLGVPQQYTERDLADAKAFGFDTFRTVDGDWGYWMCFLERNVDGE